MGYGEPDWATPGDTSAAQVQAGTPGVPITATQNNVNSGEKTVKARCGIAVLSIVNMGLAAMMGSLGGLTIIKLNLADPTNLTKIFLSVYMLVFGLILFLYEFIWWQPFKGLNKNFRKNFGFMYGLRGKGLYLVFIAFLCLGLVDQGSMVSGLDVATGISWLVVGVFHVFIGIWWPEVNLQYKPPTAGLADSGVEEQPNPV